MPEEFYLLSRLLAEPKTRTIGPRTFFEGSIDGCTVVLACSRIGKVAAATTVTILIASFGVDAVLFTGVAGGIAPHVSIGDVVVARELVQHDFDIKGLLGCPRLSIPLLGMSHIPSCERMAIIAENAASSVVADEHYIQAVSRFTPRIPGRHSGVLASGDRFISSNTEREELQALIPNLLCVEMEGAAVAQVCIEHEVPFAVARIISDAADESSIVDFGAFIQSAAALGSEKFVRNFISNVG
jgi:adenosylhomocysteine nucleosidase